jgi:hypothetical protein
MPNIQEVIRDHVSLSITCVDRLYVNGYLPALQSPGQLCYFLRDHLGYPIPSPALFAPMHDRFVKDVDDFAKQHEIPVVHFERGRRKDDVAAEYRADFDAPEGVVFIGVAQEKMRSFRANKCRGPRGGVYFQFSRQPVTPSGRSEFHKTLQADGRLEAMEENDPQQPAVDDEESYDWDLHLRYENNSILLRSLQRYVEEAEALLTSTPVGEFGRRTLVRTMFSVIEGLAASAIDWARYYATDDSMLKDRYSEPERLVLNAKIAKVNDKGEAEWLPDDRYLATKPNLRFALSLVGRGAKDLPAVEYGDGGWQALLDGLKIRDRLMHPKRATDIVVTDEDLATVRRGRTWFTDTYRARDLALQRTIASELAPLVAEWMRKARERERRTVT